MSKNKDAAAIEAITKSKQMTVKCLNRLSTENEMSAPHVTSLLLGYDDKYTSHTFRSLNLYHFLPSATFESQNENCADDNSDLIQWGDDGRLVLVNTKLDYIYRGDELGSICLYDYVATIDKVTVRADHHFLSRHESSSTNSNVKGGRPPNQRFRFSKQHPQTTSHIQKTRSAPFIPVLSTFPPSRESNEVKFAQMMLLLFKPFHSMIDLCADGDWLAAFHKYHVNAKHKLLIDNIEEMHKGLVEKKAKDAERSATNAEVDIHDERNQYMEGHEPLTTEEENELDEQTYTEGNRSNDVHTKQGLDIVVNSGKLVSRLGENVETRDIKKYKSY